jgi:peroxiredoxin
MNKLLSMLLTISVVGITACSAGETKSLAIGETVPMFRLNNYDGTEYRLDKILAEHEYTVVMFIATQCPVSNAYNERMVELQEQFAAKGVAFIGVNSNKQEDAKEVAAHAKEHKFVFPVLKDPRNKVADQYGAQVTPEVYVVNKEGRLLYHGRIDDSRNVSKVKSHDLATALNAFLEGKSITETEPKAFGCTIKRVGEES